MRYIVWCARSTPQEDLCQCPGLTQSATLRLASEELAISLQMHNLVRKIFTQPGEERAVCVHPATLSLTQAVVNMHFVDL